MPGKHKPRWPYPSQCHLTANVARNQWTKKIRGKVYSFGVLDAPEAALAKYLRDGPALHAGRQPATGGEATDGITVKELCGRYLVAQRSRLNAGELRASTLRNYEFTIKFILKVIAADIRHTPGTPRTSPPGSPAGSAAAGCSPPGE